MDTNITPSVRKHPLYQGLLLASAVALPLTVSAQPMLEEVIVTAQKREQSLQDIPASVSAISGDFVNEVMMAGENIRALNGRVPSLVVESSNGRQSPRFYIRGVGNYDFDVNATQPVSMIMDEIALENAVLKSIPLFDVQRVEVLAGPQGTLFGRGTTSGVVKVDSVRPSDETEGFISGGYGSRGTYAIEGAVGGGLTENLNARVAIKYNERDDWINNGVKGNGDHFGAFDEFAYRIQLEYLPTENLSILGKIHGFDQSGSQPQVFYANAFTPGTKGLRRGFNEEKSLQDGKADFELDHTGGSLMVVYDFDNGLKFTSITGYDELDNFSRTDLDGGLIGGPEAIGALNRQAFFNVSTGDGLSDHSQFTQEFRLSGDTDHMFYQFGLYYLKEDITVDSVDFDTPAGNPVAKTQADQETTSAAIFGQIDYSLTDRLNVIAGLRYTADDKELEVIPGAGSTAPAANIDKDDSYFNGELALNYALTDDVSVFGRVATASRGPVTLGRFGFTSSAEKETNTSFEAGVKSRFWDGRARWNATAYYFELDDMQLTATGGTGNTNELLNADVEGYGFETDIEVLVTERLSVSGNLSYNYTEIVEDGLLVEMCSSTPLCTPKDPIRDTFEGFFGTVNLVEVEGNALPRAPEWIANIKIDYEIPIEVGTLYASTDWNYRDDSSIFLYESVEFVAEERWIGGVRFGYRNNAESLDLSLVGRNITDEIVADGAIDFLNMTGFVNEPAYWGVEARYSF
jgi:iron complex outermembrane recepter protein